MITQQTALLFLLCNISLSLAAKILGEESQLIRNKSILSDHHTLPMAGLGAHKISVDALEQGLFNLRPTSSR